MTLSFRFLIASIATLVLSVAAPAVSQAAGQVCSTFSDCAINEACAVGPNNTPSVLTSGQKICIAKDSNAIASKYGAACSANSECPVGTLCKVTPPSSSGVCDVEDPRDIPTGPTTVAPSSGSTNTAPVGTTQGSSTGALQNAQATGFGTNALGGTGLFNGSTDTLFVGLVRQVFVFIGALLVVILVTGGTAYMLSSSEKATGRAKGIITAGIVGAIIAFASYLIAELVIRILTGTGPAA